MGSGTRDKIAYSDKRTLNLQRNNYMKGMKSNYKVGQMEDINGDYSLQNNIQMNNDKCSLAAKSKLQSNAGYINNTVNNNRIVDRFDYSNRNNKVDDRNNILNNTVNNSKRVDRFDDNIRYRNEGGNNDGIIKTTFEPIFKSITNLMGFKYGSENMNNNKVNNNSMIYSIDDNNKRYKLNNITQNLSTKKDNQMVNDRNYQNNSNYKVATNSNINHIPTQYENIAYRKSAYEILKNI
jgi:hypothetical protein